MRVNIWIAILLAPLVSFLLVPLLMLIFTALNPADGGWIGPPDLNRGIFIYWLYVIPFGYAFALLVLTPARYIFVYLRRFSVGGFAVFGGLFGAFLAATFGAVESVFSLTLWSGSACFVAAMFAYLTAPMESVPSAI